MIGGLFSPKPEKANTSRVRATWASGNDRVKPDRSESLAPKLDVAKVEECLRRYDHEICAYFPFFPLANNHDVNFIRSLRSNRPFFLLGLLCATSFDSPRLHRQLDAEFRKAFGQKVIANGERSLDLVQGALLYIARSEFPY